MQLTVISSEVAAEVILEPNCQQTRLLKEEEEDLVRQNSKKVATAHLSVGSEWESW